MAETENFWHKVKDFLFFTILRLVLGLRYKLQINTMPTADGRPILFLPNHPALIDPVIMMRVLGPAFRPRPLVDETQAMRPLVKQAVRFLNAVIIPDAGKAGRSVRLSIEDKLLNVAQALKDGHNVLFYPSGEIYRTGRERLAGKSGLHFILNQFDSDSMPRLVLIRSTGLWGSRFSCASGQYPRLSSILIKGLLALLLNLIFFIPKRRVSVQMLESPELRSLALTAYKKDLNQYLENFYNEQTPPPQSVPLYFWQGSQPVAMPEPKEVTRIHHIAASPIVREQVLSYLRGLSGISQISPEHFLATDLGLDSLAQIEISVWLEEEFGFTVPELEALNTVQDCLDAAMGALGGQMNFSLKPVPKNWFHKKQGDNPSLSLADAPPLQGHNAPSLPSLFLANARKHYNSPLVADQPSGVRTFGQMLTGVELLLPFLSARPNARLGVMLPLSPAALLSWLAVMLAGKTPVMVNWTVGMSNLRHCLGLSQVDTIITAKAFINVLQRQGFAIDDVTWPDGRKIDFVYLEDLVKQAGLAGKLKAWWRSFFSRRLQRKACLVGTDGISEIAAILFTSGSESLPKAVPLTHANLCSNLNEAIKILALHRSDRLLGMLPPFHSLGLLANMALPIAAAMPMACHPNPTEANILNRLVKNYKTTLIVSPPTFLQNMLERATGSPDLASLKLGFVGAEKCPEKLWRLFAEQCPSGVLCEGYGVSECSPIISVNRPGHVYPGTVGPPLDSLRVLLLAGPETNPALTEDRQALVNEPGILLVRGPSVFSGYLTGPPGFPQPSSPFICFAGKTWYKTGDVLSQDADGVLTFLGRMKRFAKIGGEMISLPQIEETLLGAFAGAQPADSGPILAVETSDIDPQITLFTTIGISREEANQALRRAGLSGLYNVRQVINLPLLPVLGTGKTDYRSLKSMLK